MGIQRCRQSSKLINNIIYLQDESFFHKHVKGIQSLSQLGQDHSTLNENPKCFTCTVISLADMCQPFQSQYSHYALLLPGHSPSVKCYRNDTGKFQWRITTFHTKRNLAFVEKIVQFLPCLTEQHSEDPVSALVELHGTGILNFTKIQATQPEPGVTVYYDSHIRLEISPRIVRFQLMNDVVAEDSVCGFLSPSDVSSLSPLLPPCP